MGSENINNAAQESFAISGNMKILRLGVIELHPAEEALIKTLFRLYGVEPAFKWHLVTNPPYDALLIDYRYWPDDLNKNAYGRSVMKVAPFGQEADDGMRRPIRSEQLVDWLGQVQLEIEGPRQIDKGIFSRWKAKPQSTALESANIGAESWLNGAGTPPKNNPEGGSRKAYFKLIRWPGPDLIQGDHNRIRIATLLTRRYFDLNSISGHANVSFSECEKFVVELDRRGLLRKMQDASPPPNKNFLDSIYGSESHKPETKNETQGVSLISRIRRRLGI